MIRIGIPKGLFYFSHAALWEAFFVNLGCEVVFSSETDKPILDAGVRQCSNDTCLPVKVFHGHVHNLSGRVDYVFIPRYASLGKDEYTCPKFCGLPDMTYWNLKRQVNILEVGLNLNESSYPSLDGVSTRLNLPLDKVEDAFTSAFDSYWSTSPEAPVASCNSRHTLAVLGHPYMIYDEYLSMRLLKKLESYNIKVLTPSCLPFETKRENAYPFQGKAFWESGFELLGSAFTFIKDRSVDGMIYISAFACGLDSMILEFIERTLQKDGQIPLLKLTMDEHTGEAGFDTRLEAFLDMLGSVSA